MCFKLKKIERRNLMAIEDDTMCMHYTLERLSDIKTETDLKEFKDEIKHNLGVNEQWRRDNPAYLELLATEDFDVLRAVRTTKDKYIRRALEKSKNVSSASKLLGLKNYQTLQNWMRELGIEDDRR
jgi:hypothetical protein